MDLSTIIDHLDNFVTTWEGWGKVFDALFGKVEDGATERAGGILDTNYWEESFNGISSAFGSSND